MYVELLLKDPITTQYISVDLGDDTSISLTKSFEEISDFTTRSSSYTKTFTIPQSSINDRFFKQAFLVNSSSFVDSVVVDAIVKYGGSDVFVGQARLSSIFNSTQGGTYEIFLTQSLPDFANIAGSIKLIDLDYQDINHTFNYDNIVSTWSYTGGSYTNYTGLTGSVLYPLAQYGYEEDKYYGVFVDSPSGFTNSSTPLSIEQFAPWVSAKYLVDKIFSRVGFSYDSEFFDSEYFNGIFCLTKTNETMGARTSSASTENANTFLATTNTGFFDTNVGNISPAYTEYFLFDVEQSDPLNVFTPSLSVNNRQHFFTSIVPGTYRLKVDFSLFITNSSFPLYVDVAMKDLDNGTIYSQVQGLLVRNEDLANFTLYFVLNLPAQRRVGFFYSRNAGGGNPNAQLGVFRSTIELFGSPVLSGTDELSFQDNIPGEITSLDFFKGIVSLFNLVVIPDGDRNFRIEKWDTYFSQGDIKDWSQKIDVGSGYTLEPTNELQKEYIISYKNSDDRYSFVNQQDRNQQFGTFRYISPVPYHQGIINIEIPFEPLPISTFDGSTESNMLLPHLYRFPTKQEIGELEARQATGETISLSAIYQTRGSDLRLGFYNGMLDFTITGATKNWYLLSGSTAVSHNTYPAVSHLSSYEYSASTFSDLNIGNQYDYWQPFLDTYVGFTSNDVFGNFWAPRIQPLYDTDVKILKGKFRLTPTEIQTLQFNDRVYFLEAYWRLLSMNDADITQTSLVDCEWIKLPYYPVELPLIPPTYTQAEPSPVPTPTGSSFSHNVYIGDNTFSLCNETAPITLVYSNCSVLSPGCSVFTDTGATNPVDEGTLIKVIGGTTIYQVIEYGIITNFQNC
jgi:hypothetical protein